MSETTAAVTAHAKPSLQSISVIKIAQPGVLFVGDSKAATVYAFELGPATAASGSVAYNLHGIDRRIAELLGVGLEAVTIRDLAIHPITKEAYVAVHRGHGPHAIPVIVRVRQDGSMAPLELHELPHSMVTLSQTVSPELAMKNGELARTLTITDLAFTGDELLIAGLSSADFSSTLYRVRYPFGAALGTSTVEIYHAVHNMSETRAPIRTMTVLPLGGQPHVLAVFTCTPLVTIPLEALTDGSHVKGKTIGELGYGNTPLETLYFQSRDGQGQTHEHVLITHKHRGPMLFPVESLADGNTKPGLSTPVGFNVVAPSFMPVPMGGVIHVDDQDAQYLATLRRNADTGALDLQSFRKGAFFRISDHISEYNLPGFVYTPEQAGSKRFQDMLWSDELPSR